MTTERQVKEASDANQNAAMSPGAQRRTERIARRRQKAEELRKAEAQNAAKVASDGFSGKQLRNAMRLAKRNGIIAGDAYEALHKLRERGIDPHQHANPIHLIVDNTRDRDALLPVPVAVSKSPAQIADENRHLLEISRVQEQIAHRRSHKMNRLIFRLYVWVIIPTLAAFFYFMMVATPLFSTSAEFVVQKSGGTSGGLGSLLSGTALGSSQEAVAVQRYIESKEAMVRLDQDYGFIEHFSAQNVDPIARLPPDASIEKAYKLYHRRVKLGYDPTEGVVKMEVMATAPETAVVFASALVGYAEEVVNNLSLRQRQDQLVGAQASFAAAEAAMEAAQRRVLSLQEERGIVSAEAELGAIMSQIAAFDLQLRQETLKLDSLLDNTFPNPARVAATEKNIARLNATVADLRDDLTKTGSGNASLARIGSDLKIAEAALATRQLMFQEALHALQSAQREADTQVGYLALNVAPVKPQQAAYPRIPENTAMAFLIFLGMYSLVSLTASVLKEQVSS